MTRMDYSNPWKHPGSATTNPFAGGEDWHPLNNVTWIPETEEVEVETCETQRIRIPARSFRAWLGQRFGSQPKYREEVICRVETQQRETGRVHKIYNS